jgi:hypothetical protein
MDITVVPTHFAKVKFHGDYHGDVLVFLLLGEGYYGGMIGHNNGRFFFLFLFWEGHK